MFSIENKNDLFLPTNGRAVPGDLAESSEPGFIRVWCRQGIPNFGVDCVGDFRSNQLQTNGDPPLPPPCPSNPGQPMAGRGWAGKGNSIEQVPSMRASLIFVLLIAVTVPPGCVTTQGKGVAYKAEAPPPGKAVVYHYRLGGFRAAPHKFRIWSGSRPVTTIGNGGYDRDVVPAGTVSYEGITEFEPIPLGLLDQAIMKAATKPGHLVTLKMRAGQTRYLRYSPKTVNLGMSYPPPIIEEVDASTAREEMAGLQRFATGTKIGR